MCCTFRALLAYGCLHLGFVDQTHNTASSFVYTFFFYSWLRPMALPQTLSLMARSSSSSCKCGLYSLMETLNGCFLVQPSDDWMFFIQLEDILDSANFDDDAEKETRAFFS